MFRRKGVLKAGLIAGALVVIVFLLVSNGIHPSYTNNSPDAHSTRGSQDARDNFILGAVILGIVGTFGIIAYYYTTIELGSKR